MKFEDEKTLNFFELLMNAKSLTKRYWVVALPPCAVVLWLLVVFAIICPDYYLSDSLIVVQEQRISSDIVKQEAPVAQKDKMEGLLQIILSRPRLANIVKRYQLYPELVYGSDIEGAVLKLRKSVIISPPESASGYQGIQSFRLSFQYKDPEVTYQVSQSLTNLFIDESIADMKRQLVGQQSFVESQLEGARKELEATEAAIRKFEQENVGRLPDDLSSGVFRIEEIQGKIAANIENISANTQRKVILKKEAEDLRSLPFFDESRGTSGEPQDNVAQLEQSLAVLLSRYSSKHPDVIRTKKRLATLKEQSKNGVSKVSIPSSTRVKIREIEKQISELDVASNVAEAENKRLKAKVAELEGAVKNKPAKEQEITKIRRDYENKKLSYDKLLKTKKDLELKADMVRTQQDTQFKIIEPPEKPYHPVWPNRFLIVLIGIVSSIAIFTGVVFVSAAFNPSFKTKEDVEETLGIKVLGVIPPLNTNFKRATIRRLAFVSAIVSSVILVVGLLVMSVFVGGGLGRFASLFGGVFLNSHTGTSSFIQSQ